MKSVLHQFDALSQALQQVASTLPAGKRTRAEELVEPFVRAAKRKWQNVLLHQAMISGVNWGELDDIGRTSPLSGQTNTLKIELPDANLVVSHRSAVVDHVYVAFDGFVAGMVNITDTLGRLLNVCFDLNIPERKVTLIAIRNKVEASPLGQVLADPRRMNWLKHVRELRGRCQHADLEDVLIHNCAAFGRSAEPCVPVDYMWLNRANDTPLTKYATDAVRCAETLVSDCIAMIVQHGTKATAPVYVKDRKDRSPCEER